ncbi:MAG: LURP-one-related family protein [Bacilli bacterium]|nr:LURP-one-related family protein [Bacilli bacterium]
MELTIKNKFFSLGGSSKVLDENSKDAFIVKGKFFTITAKKFVYDLNGNKLFTIRNKFWHLFRRKALVYDANKRLVARVIRNFRIRQVYTIEGAQEEIKVVANGPIGLGFDMSILMGGREIGHIKRPYVQWTDTFNVTFDDPQDAAILVALVIGIDNIQDQAKNANS